MHFRFFLEATWVQLLGVETSFDFGLSFQSCHDSLQEVSADEGFLPKFS